MGNDNADITPHEVHRHYFLTQPPEKQDAMIAPAEFDRMVQPHFLAAPPGEQRDARDRALQAQLIGLGHRPVGAGEITGIVT